LQQHAGIEVSQRRVTAGFLVISFARMARFFLLKTEALLEVEAGQAFVASDPLLARGSARDAEVLHVCHVGASAAFVRVNDPD
jgi:hypothetical protein